MQRRKRIARDDGAAGTKTSRFRLRPFHLGSEFQDNLAAMVRAVSNNAGIATAIGTSRRHLQLRLRGLDACSDEEIDAVFPEDHVSAQRVIDNLGQYRVLMLALDAKIIVKSGSSRALLDRHPDYPHSIIDSYLDSLEKERKKSRMARIVRGMRQLERTDAQILAALKRLEKNNDEVIEFLESLSSKVAMSGQAKKLIARLQHKEGADQAVSSIPRYSESDLERTIVE